MDACHTAFEMLDASRVGEVRRAAVQIAKGLGFDEVACGRVAIVATELGNNLVRYAQSGQMLAAAVESESGEPLVELMSLDRGPGIANVSLSLSDGHSTGGTPGTGLGAVRRLSRVFDLYSHVPAGSIVLARVGATEAAPRANPQAKLPSYEVGALRLPAPGEVVCGDNWCVQQEGGRTALFMADGLGHGPFAQDAANAAVTEVLRHTEGPPSAILEKVHQALSGTRGAAVAMAVVDEEAASLSFAGVGNIAGRIISGVEDRSLMSQHGTAGMQIRRVQDVRYELPPYAVLLLHSDGLASRWKIDEERGLLQHHPALIAGWLLRDHLRGRDDATVVVLKKKER